MDDDDDVLGGGDSSMYNTSLGLSVSRTSRHSQIVQEIMDITGSWKRYRYEHYPLYYLRLPENMVPTV